MILPNGGNTGLASARNYTSGFPEIAETTVTWSAAGSPVIDAVHLQLCRGRLVLNQQRNGHEQRGYSQ